MQKRPCRPFISLLQRRLERWQISGNEMLGVVRDLRNTWRRGWYLFPDAEVEERRRSSLMQNQQSRSVMGALRLAMVVAHCIWISDAASTASHRTNLLRELLPRHCLSILVDERHLLSLGIVNALERCCLVAGSGVFDIDPTKNGCLDVLF